MRTSRSGSEEANASDWTRERAHVYVSGMQKRMSRKQAPAKAAWARSLVNTEVSSNSLLRQRLTEEDPVEVTPRDASDVHEALRERRDSRSALIETEGFPSGGSSTHANDGTDGGTGERSE